MNYPESVRFLYSLGNEIKTAKLGLDRMRSLLSALGDPQNAFRSVHVAGTNGKGSTAAMIEAGLRAERVRTGLFTSPHLMEPTERISIDGEYVSTGQFSKAFDEVHGVVERLLASGDIDVHPTYFETVTAMAFLLFREMRVHTAVVEVGLGGRLDATNLIRPAVAVITPVDFDHERYLGTTIAEIAREKAGILKPGVPLVMARQRAEAEWAIEQAADELGIECFRTASCRLDDVEVSAHGSRLKVDGVPVECTLAGEHQIENALTAVVALRLLNVAPKGIARAVWPGRLERVGKDPEVILDGAHNPAGARALAAYIERFYKGRHLWLIYGTMRDKAIDEVVSTLFPLATEIVATAPKFARALRPEAVRDAWPGENIRIAEGIEEALRMVRSDARPEDVVFVTGSLFLVGEARGLLRG